MTAEPSTDLASQHTLIARLSNPHRVVYIRFIGTHAQYDAIDAQSI